MGPSRNRRERPRWTLATVLLLVSWSPLAIWLNVRAREAEIYIQRTDSTTYWAYYGFPWLFGAGTTNVVSSTFRPGHTTVFSYGALFGDVVLGLAGVALLTRVSRCLLRRLMPILAAYTSAKRNSELSSAEPNRREE